MYRSWVPWILCVGGGLLPLRPGVGWAAESSTARWFPERALVALEVDDVPCLVEQAVGPSMTAALAELPAWRTVRQSPGLRQVQALVHTLALGLDRDWRSALAALTQGGLGLALCPEDRVILTVEAESEALLRRVHDLLLDMVRGAGGAVATASRGGVTLWSFDGREHHALLGRRLLLGNSRAALEDALDLEGRASLADRVSYRAARTAADPDRAAFVYVDLETLRRIPAVAAALSQQRDQPLLALLLAGIVEGLGRAPWLGLDLDGDATGVSLDLRLDTGGAAAEGAAAFALPRAAGAGVPPLLTPPGHLAELSLYRDLHAFYAAKDDLFPERTSGLIFFENMMGIFFSGRDLTEEVLARLRPGLRLVAARQTYDPNVGTPAVQIPGVALVARLRDTDRYDEMVEEAWQKALGLINFTRGQQALPGLIIDRPTYRGERYSVAYFSSREVTDREHLPFRYNVRPALALPGDYVILSSSEALARDLIEAVQASGDGPAGASTGLHSLLDVAGPAVAALLRANRDALVRSNMVDKGHSRAEAAQEIDLLCGVVGLIERLHLTLGGGDARQGRLRLTWHRPGVPDPPAMR